MHRTKFAFLGPLYAGPPSIESQRFSPALTWKRRSPLADYWNYELLALGEYTLSAGRLTVAVAFALAGLIISRIAAWLAYRWLDRRFDLSAGADRAALRAVKVVIVLIGFYLAVDQLGFGRFSFGQIQDSELTVSGVFLALIIVWVTWNVSQVAAELAVQWIAELGISRSLTTLITNLTRALVIFIGFYIAASSLGFDLNVVLLPLSALGLGLGFGMQRIAENFVSGVILLGERPVKDGDVISISGVTGVVESIGLRSTVIRTFGGTEVIMPNSELITNHFDNWTLTNTRVRGDANVGVAYGSNPEQVMEILMGEMEAHADVLEDPGPRVFFREFGDSALNFRVIYWVEAPAKRLSTLTDLLCAWYQRFAEAGIEIPFPQHDVHIRSGALPAPPDPER